MSNICTGNTLGLQVLEVLGLDQKHVTSIEICMQASQAATVTVHRHLDDDEARRVADCLSRYELKPLDNSDDIKSALRKAAAERPDSES